MKKILFSTLISCFGVFAAHGAQENVTKKDLMYTQMGSGYAWMRTANIACATVENDWDAAIEGYNAKLNNVAFLDFALGFRPATCFDLDISYGIYQTMHYQKYQTGTSTTAAFTGTKRMRFFDLDHKNILINGILHPSGDIFCITLSRVTIFPYVGAGIGAGFYQLGKFYTIAYSELNDSFGVGSTTSIGQLCCGTSFAWQGTLGLTIKSTKQPIAFDIGYRYYSGGNFFGPKQCIMANTTDYQGGYWTPGASWKGRIRSNQLVFAFRFDF